jgi:hypothetical protein
MCDRNRACELLVDWLMNRVISTATGDSERQLDVDPGGKFWLGRLTPEAAVINSPFGDRSERMEPCAIGFRLRPRADLPWRLSVTVTGCAWFRDRALGQNMWRKTDVVQGRVEIDITSAAPGTYRFDAVEFEQEMSRHLGVDVLRASIRVDVERGRDGLAEQVILLVNESPESSSALADTGIYEAKLRVEGLETLPFLLESLPDSFRYDRRVPAYGINCGVEARNRSAFESTDVVRADRQRPAYWTVDVTPPNLTFAVLSQDPLGSLQQLVSCHRTWGDHTWSQTSLDRRMELDGWSAAMRAEADRGAAEFAVEAGRLERGLRLLESDHELLKSFRMMNEAMSHSSRVRYAGWRPFQVGFLLANLASILGQPEETSVVDILWFATGGGKTETYLGLLVMAAFHDRLKGKLCGITAWSRFPLRLLSLQQTQRFAEAIAAAEIVRRLHRMGGRALLIGILCRGN